MKINDLKHYAREYGIHSTDNLSKTELIEIVVDGISQWIEKALLESE